MNKSAAYSQSKLLSNQLGLSLSGKWRGTSKKFWNDEVKKLQRNFKLRNNNYNKSLKLARQNQFNINADLKGTDYNHWKKMVNKLRMRAKRNPEHRQRLQSRKQNLKNIATPKLVSVAWNATLYFGDTEQKTSGVFITKDGKIEEAIKKEVSTKIDEYGRPPSDFKFTYVLSKVNKRKMNERKLPMGEKLYIHDKKAIDINQSSKNCVLIAIQSAIKKKYKTPTFEDILKILGREVAENNLMTCDELLKVAKVYKLNVLICNMFNKVIANYCEYGNKARGSLMGFQHNGHLYTIKSKSKRSFSKKMRHNSWTVDKIRKPPKAQLITLSDFKEILKNNIDEESKTESRYITTEKIHIDDVFSVIKDSGRLFSVNVDDGLYFKSISHRNITLVSNPYANECLELEQKESLELGSITNMTTQILPKPNKSSLSVNGMEIFDDWRMNTPINFCESHIPAGYKAYDITKCYTSCLLDLDHLPLYTVFDEPAIFSGKISLGFYYVDTNNSYPLCGRNWYFSELVKYCLLMKIISIADIKYEYTPQYTQENKLKQPILDVYKKYPYAKTMINSYIGSLNCKPKGKDSVFITNSLKELSCYAQNSTGFNTTTSGLYYLKYTKNARKDCTTNRPIYSAIIDMAKIKIHKLSSMVGGKLLAVKTDCIYVAGKHTPPPLSDEIGGYRIDDSKLPQYLRKLSFENKYKLPASKPYIHGDIKGSMCLNGAAGTGKSYIINNSIAPTYQRAAFTNTAARNIKGKTLHTIFNIRGDKQCQYTKPIVVDEYSMIPENLYSVLLNRKLNNPESELILSGDDRQIAFIPLNIDRDDLKLNKPLIKDVSNSDVFKYLTNYNIMQLTECRRADREFFNKCLDGKYAELSNPRIGNTLVNITRTNKLRIKLNININKKFTKNKQILLSFTDKDYGNIDIVENSRWIVKNADRKRDLIKNDFYEVKNGKFCNLYGTILPLTDYPLFELRWAMTVNKVQGQTLKEDYNIYQSDFMDKRSLYTAVSRATRVGQFNFI
tara:strand:+ start:670 stop:3708 length:3039 start_codon:yes stop_codon:yes gene_type:complete